MGPQNSDPNNNTQPDLSSILGSSTTPADPISPPAPNPIPTPPVPAAEPTMDTTPTPTLTIDTAPPPMMDQATPSVGQTPVMSAEPIMPPASDLVPPTPVPIENTMPTTETMLPPAPQPAPADNLAVPTGPGSDLNTAFSWSSNGGLSPQTPTNNPSPNPFDPYSSNSAPPESSSAPTDLSQLTGANPEPQNVYTPPMSAPETLVVSPSTPDSLQAESSDGKGISKWVWIAGGILILLVIGASAYFILGIGKPKEVSVPATEQPALVTPPQPTPATQVPTETPATSSAGFGGVGGGGQQSSASSAADILKQKLQK